MPTTDTSYLYALLDGADAHHEEAKRMAGGRTTLAVPSVVLTELLQLVRFRAKGRGEDGNAVARAARRALETIRGFRLEQACDAARAAKLYDENVGLSYADAVVIAVALERGDDLYTFDEGQGAVLAQQGL